MEMKQIKELIALMEQAGLKKLFIKEKGGGEVHLEREEKNPPAPSHHPVHFHPASHVEHLVPSAHKHHAHPAEDKPAKGPEKEGRYVTSPMVGTFYGAPSPEDPAFIKVGDVVDENTVVCIIEAMKVMNEVKAGMKGTVAEILVESAHPVEFGSRLIRIV